MRASSRSGGLHSCATILGRQPTVVGSDGNPQGAANPRLLPSGSLQDLDCCGLVFGNRFVGCVHRPLSLCAAPTLRLTVPFWAIRRLRLWQLSRLPSPLWPNGIIDRWPGRGVLGYIGQDRICCAEPFSIHPEFFKHAMEFLFFPPTSLHEAHAFERSRARRLKCVKTQVRLAARIADLDKAKRRRRHEIDIAYSGIRRLHCGKSPWF